jgi:cytochrome c peroxidase
VIVVNQNAVEANANGSLFSRRASGVEEANLSAAALLAVIASLACTHASRPIGTDAGRTLDTDGHGRDDEQTIGTAFGEDAGGDSPLRDAQVASDATIEPAPESASDAAASTQDAGFSRYEWQLPEGFPAPEVPSDNPMTPEKVELGRHLFYDPRLSHDNSMSCATCHRQELAFTDGATVSTGITGQHTPRNSMMLANIGYASSLTWANPLQLLLERQAVIPMFGDTPIELGLKSEDEVEAKLRSVKRYQELFSAAFPGEEEPITAIHLVRALASFERTLISGDSAFDRYIYLGHKTALSDEARKGYVLFNSEKLECFHCHVGFNLSDHTTFKNKPFIDRIYHNTGLYNIDGEGGYPAPNTGLHAVTGIAEDMGKFKAPSLRNIAVTAPYMHDGSIATLDEVLDHYMHGGRVIAEGENAGDGSTSPMKDPLIRGFELSEEERTAVIAFLNSLTDEKFLKDPRFSDPWPAQ